MLLLQVEYSLLNTTNTSDDELSADGDNLNVSRFYWPAGEPSFEVGFDLDISTPRIVGLDDLDLSVAYHQVYSSNRTRGFVSKL